MVGKIQTTASILVFGLLVALIVVLRNAAASLPHDPPDEKLGLYKSLQQEAAIECAKNFAVIK